MAIGIKLKLSTVGVNFCVFWKFGNGSQELIKNRGKMVIFVICVIRKCDLFLINTPQGISMITKIFLPLFLINSCQFHISKNILGMKYSPLKITILQLRSLSTIWLKMSHLIRSVSDHSKCGIILKLPTMGVHLCVFGKFSVVAMATGAKN